MKLWTEIMNPCLVRKGGAYIQNWKKMKEKFSYQPKLLIFNQKFIKSQAGELNYSQISCPSYILSDKTKDNSVLLNNNKILIVLSFFKDGDIPYISGKEFSTVLDFFYQTHKVKYIIHL